MWHNRRGRVTSINTRKSRRPPAKGKSIKARKMAATNAFSGANDPVFIFPIHVVSSFLDRFFINIHTDVGNGFENSISLLFAFTTRHPRTYQINFRIVLVVVSASIDKRLSLKFSPLNFLIKFLKLHRAKNGKVSFTSTVDFFWYLRRKWSVIFQKPLHYQHKNLWSGKERRGGWGKFNQTLCFCTCLGCFCCCSSRVVSYFCQFAFLFSRKVFAHFFLKENFNEIEGGLGA